MANEYLQRTPTSTGNRKVHTVSVWAKMNDVSASYKTFFSAGSSSPAARTEYGLDSNQFFNMGINDDGSLWHSHIASAKGRDCGNWMHFCVSVDSTQSDGKDRIKYWINGVFVQTTVANELNVNADTPINNTVTQYIGRYINTTSQNWNGELSDFFLVDGQALTPDVFGFYKQGNGYISAGSTQATDFRPGQWVPKTPRVIKAQIERNGGFGVNGFYLPMNDSSNFGADFHTTPNSIITLKGEDLPQPRNGAPETTDAYVSQLRTDPYAANLVLAVPGISGGQGSGYGDYSADIKGSGSNKTLTANGNAGVAVTASYYGSALSFDGTGDYLQSSYISDWDLGNGDFTIECWVKTTDTATNYPSIVGRWQSAGNACWDFRPQTTDASDNFCFVYSTNGTAATLVNSGINICTGDFYHLVAERNGTNITLYVNGVATVVHSIGTSTIFNTSNAPLYIGYDPYGSSYYNGYIQDLRVYKGVAKYKGGFDVPRPYTPVGISTWRAVSDCTANNFATWNPLFNGIGNLSVTNGNLSLTESTTSTSQMSGTVEVSSGKWYYETHIGANPFNGSVMCGIAPATRPSSNIQNRTSYRSNGDVYDDTGGSAVQSGTTYTTGDIIGVAFDVDAKKLWFAKNGSWVYSGEPSTGGNTAVTLTLDAYSPFTAFDGGAGTAIINSNFGQNPTFSGNTTAGTFTDSNGKGLFKYQPPSGFLALCEDNLPTPAIKNPGEHFKTVLYNNAATVTGIGFTPDLIWHKSRTQTYPHYLYDSVRGVGAKGLNSNTTSAEGANDALGILSFDEDGFSFSSDAGLSQTNAVAWCWRAGAGTTSTNTDGTIPSVVSVNQDAGFSIVSYTGNSNASATVGHNLDKKPSLMIVKERTSTSTSGGIWVVYHAQTNTVQFLNLPDAGSTISGGTNGSVDIANATSTVFPFINGASSVNNWNNDGSNYIAYCWAEIEGFSKFGSYVGNLNADGPFVYCGFKPAFVMIKWADGAAQWVIQDSSRTSTNPSTKGLLPSSSSVELDDSTLSVDFLSNGFKIRNINASYNNTSTYIFAAFAESPFTTANAK